VRFRYGFATFAVAFSPDGKKVAAGGAGDGLCVWDAATGQELHRFPQPGDLHSVAFSPDGKTLAASGKPVILRDVASGKELLKLDGHSNWVLRVAFSPDGKV